MAHFAKLDENNVVIDVLVVSNDDVQNLPFPESEPLGIAFLLGLFPDTVWKQTSYNANFRKNYAGIGYTYDEARDAFIMPMVYPSWVLNELTCQWEAPIPKPGTDFYWDEEVKQWIPFDL